VTTVEHVDVLIIGAGLSGIGAAAHLAKDLPATSYAVLERREVSGGTWDLFRYPGVRSDSDMHTIGYRFFLSLWFCSSFIDGCQGISNFQCIALFGRCF